MRSFEIRLGISGGGRGVFLGGFLGVVRVVLLFCLHAFSTTASIRYVRHERRAFDLYQ